MNMICPECSRLIDIDKELEEYNFDADRCVNCMADADAMIIVKRITKGVNLDERMYIDE